MNESRLSETFRQISVIISEMFRTINRPCVASVSRESVSRIRNGARPSRAARDGRPSIQGLGRYVVHELPFTVNAVGAASLVDQVPWKPSEVEPPAAMAPL